jgi:hypothetical protein
MKRFRRRYTLALVALLLRSVPASAFQGPFYGDPGLQGPDTHTVCTRIIAAFKQHSVLQSYSARCEFLLIGEPWKDYRTADQIVLQFRPIGGTAYNMVYDLPGGASSQIADELLLHLDSDLGRIGLVITAQALFNALHPPSQRGR